MGKLVTSKNIQVLDRTKVLHGPRTQTCGETNDFKISKCQTEPRYCMVIRLKPIGKLVTSKYLSARQNQGIAWSSDSNLWRNQSLQKISKYQIEPRYCMVLGPKPMGKLVTPTNSLHRTRDQPKRTPHGSEFWGSRALRPAWCIHTLSFSGVQPMLMLITGNKNDYVRAIFEIRPLNSNSEVPNVYLGYIRNLHKCLISLISSKVVARGSA